MKKELRVLIEFLTENKSDYDFYDKFQYLVMTLCGDNYYITDFLVDEKAISLEDGEILYTWLVQEMNMEKLFKLFKTLEENFKK